MSIHVATATPFRPTTNSGGSPAVKGCAPPAAAAAAGQGITASAPLIRYMIVAFPAPSTPTRVLFVSTPVVPGMVTGVLNPPPGFRRETCSTQFVLAGTHCAHAATAVPSAPRATAPVDDVSGVSVPRLAGVSHDGAACAGAASKSAPQSAARTIVNRISEPSSVRGGCSAGCASAACRRGS